MGLTRTVERDKVDFSNEPDAIVDGIPSHWITKLQNCCLNEEKITLYDDRNKVSWKGKCFQCAWANMAAVEIEYNWGVSKKYRFESFCYSPKSCKFYKMGKRCAQKSMLKHGITYVIHFLKVIAYNVIN